MSEPRLIQLTDASVRFNVKSDDDRSLKAVLSRLWRRQAVPRRTVDALKNINLRIEHGERVGLIGPNGAGKSTLLKVMAGIYCPTSGQAEIRGHVCPLFEFATGFEMELSGWDNIRIRGMLLGMHPDEIQEKMRAIAEFSSLGEFLNYPVRTYSSGMFIRLAFSISTAINPEILLLDEVIGAGDMDFSKKAAKRMEEFIGQGKIVILASHALGSLPNFCSRAVWLDKGVVRMDGPIKDVIAAYSSR